jgi:class 3 adenylate cyclase
MPELHSGTVTLLFTDIEGSTQLLHRLGDAYGELVRDHRQIVREAAARGEGVEVDTQGDAFFFSFPRARDAVVAAADVQRSLEGHTWPQAVDVKVRIGLHTGEPTVGDEGYLGLDVVRGARICGAAHGGQVLLSETTRAVLGRTLPNALEVRDLGKAPLKDLDDERVFQLVIPGVPDRFPPPRTHDSASLEAAIEARALGLADRITAHVESQVEQALAGRDSSASLPKGSTTKAPTEKLAGLAAVGLGTLVALAAVVVGLVLIVRWAV